ncbi:MAG: response regulator [Oscillospiraceae bacterium]
MKTILVDDEMWSMEQFEYECKHNLSFEIIGMFKSPITAIEFAENNLVEFALLDIEMPEMNGIELGQKLKQINPEMILVYVSAHSGYTLEALKIKADYYVLKPYTLEDVADVVKRVKLLARRLKKRVYFRTFGKFDVFIDDEIVKFTNSKAKELLALCVDKVGGTVTMEEAIDKLWEDRAYDDNVKSLYRRAVVYLNNLFLSYELNNVFKSSRGKCNITKSDVDCDYYNYIEDKSLVDFHKEYLLDYSWAEETVGKLCQI